jgi:hypothetical protein
MIPHFQRDYRLHSRVKMGDLFKAHGGSMVGIIEAWILAIKPSG